MDSEQGLPIVPFATLADWQGWLETNHAEAEGVWVKLAKKDSGIESITYGEALEVALCFGWIDSQKRSFDQQFFLQRFTPRGPRSKWSQINREKVEGLIAERRMQPAGMAQVQQAKADGRWERAYASQSRATVPEDLQRELDARPAAKAFFESLESHNRYAILYRIQEAKRPETRARRIAKFVAMLEAGERVHP